jgi:uncharacterized protein
MTSSKNHITRVLRVSHQFKNFPKSFSDEFKSYEFNSAGAVESWSNRSLVHTNYATIDPLFAKKLEDKNVFEKLVANNVKRFSFDVGPCYKEVKEVNGQYIGVGEKLNPIDVMYWSEENLSSIRHRFPKDCELAIENLNYYPTGAYDDVCDGTFYSMACNRLDVKMVFDISHARVSAQNLGYDFISFVEDFDFSQVTEVHLSRPRFNDDGTAIDAHDAPLEEEYEILQQIIEKTSGPVDVIIEYYKDVKGIINAYNRLAEIYP